MGWISVVFVHKAIDEARQCGAGPEQCRRLFQSVNVDPNAPVDPKRLIPDTVFFDLLERIAEQSPDGHLIALRIGAAMRCDDYGAFGLAFKSAPDLLRSYRRVERYGKIVTSIANFQVIEAGSTVLMEVIPSEPLRPGLAMTNELALAAALSLSREVSGGPFAATAVHLVRPASRKDSELEGFFGCPIMYGAGRDALEVQRDALEKPNRLGDPGLSVFFEDYLDRELGEIADPLGLVDLVQAEIRDALSEGMPSVAYIAGRLGLSQRTLQRRLAEAGWMFQDLAAEARRKLAEYLLRNSDYALAEVAFLTGFSDQSIFSRAFRRWNDETPANFRNKN